MSSMCFDSKEIKETFAIDVLENEYDLNFSVAFKAFFKINNAGIPKHNLISVNSKEYEIRCFLSFNDDEYNSIKKPLASFQEETNGKMVPFAKDSGDNYYCLNVENGKVYFWDKDDDLYYMLTESFESFIELLT